MASLQQNLKQCEDYQGKFKAKLQNLQESLNNSNDALGELRTQEKSLQKALGMCNVSYNSCFLLLFVSFSNSLLTIIINFYNFSFKRKKKKF